MKKHFLVGVVTSGVLLAGYNLFACPSGQSCPAGKDCVADSSLCVADSSSSTTGSGSSTEPTVIKDQFMLTFDPNMAVGTLSPGGSCTVNCTFQPSTVGIKAGTSTVSGTPGVTATFSLAENTSGASLSVGGTCTLCVTFDPQNAPTPSLVTVPLTH